MSFLNKSIIVGLSALGIALSVNPAMAGKNAETVKSDSILALDFNEQTHLEFMCNALEILHPRFIPGTMALRQGSPLMERKCRAIGVSLTMVGTVLTGESTSVAPLLSTRATVLIKKSREISPELNSR